jgi:cytochrome d ubiquinol oxidase subunit I
MKIAATEALWNTQQPASFSLFQIGGFTKSDQTPAYSIEIPGLLSYLATGSFQGKVVGLNQNQDKQVAQHGPGNYLPNVELEYWCMRVMAYLGGLMLLIALWGGGLLWRKKLERAKWFQRVAMGAIVVPFLACFGGWILTETGRQPWIVYDLQQTANAVSPTSTTTKVAFSLAVFVGLYTALAIVDFYLMRRYARLDPPETGGDTAEGAALLAAPGF